MTKRPVIFFDWDGTLADSMPLCIAEVRLALERMNMPELPEALIAPANLRQLRADAACLLAEARPEEWMEARKLTPIYLRLPQAERERKQRLEAEAQK